MGKRATWTDDELVRAVSTSRSMAETIRRLGLVPLGGNYRTIRGAILRLGLDRSHWLGQAWRRHQRGGGRAPRPLEQLLVHGSEYTDRGLLKRRLIAAGLLRYACGECGSDSWRGRPLSLHLHHVNGSDNDNRLANLQLLCPNCHSQTPSYCGRNKGKALARMPNVRPGGEAG